MRVFETKEEVIEHCAKAVIDAYNQRLHQGNWNMDNLHVETMAMWDCPKVHEVFKDKPSKTLNKKTFIPLVLAKVKEIQETNAI
jgi:hypothetical protein